MAISPETTALIAALPDHERDLLEAFGVWRLRARPANGTSDLCRLSIAGDKNPALRPHILAVLRSADARLTAEGVLMSATALMKGEPAPTAEPIRAPSRKPAPAVVLTLAIPSAEEIDALIEAEEGAEIWDDLALPFHYSAKTPAGVIATAGEFVTEALPPAPSISPVAKATIAHWMRRTGALPPAPSISSVEASTPAERINWIDAALGPADAPAPTLDAPAPSEPAEADLDAEIIAFAPAYILEGRPQTVFVRSRTTEGRMYSVLIARDGRALSCSCPSTRPCWHLDAALLAANWEARARALVKEEGLTGLRKAWAAALARMNRTTTPADAMILFIAQ